MCVLSQTSRAFEAWKDEHDVSYPDAEEEEKRFRAFEESYETVAEHDRRRGSENGGSDARYTLGLNSFADMTWCGIPTVLL